MRRCVRCLRRAERLVQALDDDGGVDEADDNDGEQRLYSMPT